MSKNRPQPIFKRTEIITDQKSLPPQEREVDDADDGSVKTQTQQEATQGQQEVVQGDGDWTEITDPAVAAETTAEKTEPAQPEAAVVVAAPQVETIKPQPVNKAMKPLLNTLTTYAETMDPSKAITEEAGGRAQYSLYRLIRDTLATADFTAFKSSWSTMLGTMNSMKDTVFNEGVVYRYAGSFTGSDNDFAIFRRVIWLMMVTMDPQGRRAALNNMNLDKVMEGMTAVERENLINFYGA